jgi:hypothetical protein
MITQLFTAEAVVLVTFLRHFSEQKFMSLKRSLQANSSICKRAPGMVSVQNPDVSRQRLMLDIA